MYILFGLITFCSLLYMRVKKHSYVLGIVIGVTLSLIPLLYFVWSEYLKVVHQTSLFSYIPEHGVFISLYFLVFVYLFILACILFLFNCMVGFLGWKSLSLLQKLKRS